MTTMLRTNAMTIWMIFCGVVVALKSTTAFHPNVAMVGQTTRRLRKQHGNTRLHYSSSSNDDGTATTSSSLSQRWWKSLLAPPASASAAASICSAVASPATLTPGEGRQQETVDAYLEFLDRRYRRLHSDEEATRKRKLQAEATATSSSKSVSFSAMDWLVNGGSQTSNAQLELQQQEDALYVLGVAGLASQKLLQKHHLQVQVSQSSDVEDDYIEVYSEPAPEEVLPSITTTAPGIVNLPSHVFIKKTLVPLIRAIYVFQRRKDQVKYRIQSQLAALASKAAQYIMNPVARRVSQGPKAIVETLLEIGGGKRNIALTLACAYAAIVLLRPILQAAVTEVSVIQ
jgi:hypothetical protein